MKNKHILILTTAFMLSPLICMGQCNGKLSKTGAAHWRAAQVLAGMANSTEDQEQVAIEYEKVIESDPTYAPAYMMLGKIYTQIGNQKGETAFDKAEYYFNRCRSICEDSADGVTVELAVLNALRRKYDNGPNKFVGTWGVWQSYTGEFSPSVEIRATKNGYSFKLLGYDGDNVVDQKSSSHEIIYTLEDVHDRRDELRKKGLTHYYDDCDHNADPGYPTYGEYNYDRTVSRFTNSITIEGDKVVQKYLKYHCDYYLKGKKTYAETENNWALPLELTQYHPPRQLGERGRVANAVDLGLSVKWASWNVGASREEEFGARYAWGETSERVSYGSLPSGESTNSIVINGDYAPDVGKKICGTKYDAAHVLWGEDWRMPTAEEFEELVDRCTKSLTEFNGVVGYKFTGPNGNSIFLPWVGSNDISYGYWSGSRSKIYYWSADAYKIDKESNYQLYGVASHIDMGNVIRAVKSK